MVWVDGMGSSDCGSSSYCMFATDGNEVICHFSN